jgi:hypothetical protein
MSSKYYSKYYSTSSQTRALLLPTPSFSYPRDYTLGRKPKVIRPTPAPVAPAVSHFINGLYEDCRDGRKDHSQSSCHSPRDQMVMRQN